MLSIAAFKFHKVKHPKSPFEDINVTLMLHLKHKTFLSWYFSQPEVFIDKFLKKWTFVFHFYSWTCTTWILHFSSQSAPLYSWRLLLHRCNFFPPLVLRCSSCAGLEKEPCTVVMRSTTQLILLVPGSTRVLLLPAKGRFQLPSCSNSTENTATGISGVRPPKLLKAVGGAGREGKFSDEINEVSALHYIICCISFVTVFTTWSSRV